MPASLRVIILKPSKYAIDGSVERFRRGFMPNSTVVYIRSMTPESLEGVRVDTVSIDEYVQTDLKYLELLHRSDQPTLLALVGVQSHQFHRSLDLAAYALANGVEHCIIGGPHPMTCDTSAIQNRGVSFSLAEAEVVWEAVLRDAIAGELKPVYGQDQRWERDIQGPVLQPPPKRDLSRYCVPLVGVYPARGCPFTCNFCSVIKIAGRQIRSQNVETTIRSLHAIKKADVGLVMFTSDNFNKYPQAQELLERMIAEDVRIPFFVQCDVQVGKDPEFIDLLGRAGCFQMFVGVESFHRQTLLAAHKAQNHPEAYDDIVRLCRRSSIGTHFSNIIGFPGQSLRDITEHVDVLSALDPDIASFYILTPVPGTEQYQDFLNAGLITENNLDRFDATTTTWAHDRIRPAELRAALFECYRRFYSLKRMRRIFARTMTKGAATRYSPSLAYALFARYSAWMKMHPMSGGIARVKRDGVADYQHLRRARYQFDFAPLPNNLELGERDAAMNRRVKIAL